MNEKIKEDSNCIIKAFENNNITIIKEEPNTFLFKATEIGKILDLTNIRVSIQNFDEDERAVRKAYDSNNIERDTIFLTSRGVYRLLYNSKKTIAKQFKKWVGDILDDLVFNQGIELKKQLEKHHLEIEKKDKLLEENKELLNETEKELKKEKTLRNKMLRRNYYDSPPGHTVYLYEDIEYDIVEDKDELIVIKIGKSTNISDREKIYSALSKKGKMLYVKYTYNCHLTEKVIQHLLDKYRPNKMVEWFQGVSLQTAINAIDAAVLFLDGQIKDIDRLIPQTKESLIKITGLTIEESVQKVKEKKIIIKIKENDYKKFIKECCLIKDDKNYYCPKQDLKTAFKIWSKNNIITDAEKYFDETFKESTVYINNIRRIVYTKIKLKPFTFSPKDSENIKDYEEFIIQNCGIDYQYRVSYIDFFTYFTEWKIKQDENYKLTYTYKQDIQKYLEKVFFSDRIYISSTTKTKHLYGLLGIGFKINNFGLNIRKRTNKPVLQYHHETGQVLKSWDSLSLAADELNINPATFSYYVKSNKPKDGFIYGYQEFEE